jgi:asparagine synthase (glutamine-hydrolysing)
MCGITGYVYLQGRGSHKDDRLKKMARSLTHRGPDGEGYYQTDGVALAHRRLKIIDLDTGDQPMFTQDGNLCIVFNGEIYNYLELKTELITLGHQFHTKSDTEIILASYLQWGESCQEKFNGMWAFALWDSRRKRLFLSRDRIGEKPLYYANYRGAFIFGSEIKSLLAYGIPPVARTELLEIYLTMGYLPAPYTFYKDIHKLRPGHYLIVEKGNILEQQYWCLPQRDEGDMLTDENEVNQKFEMLLNDSVRLRIRSDVPFGAFLSGGLDSSSIVSLMNRHCTHPVETFTIGFQEKQFDERELARDVAKAFATNHHEHVIKPEAIGQAITHVLQYYDEPFGDSSAIPTGHVCKEASRHVKMVLSGDGGDEILSGYTIYQGEKFSARYQMMPAFLKRAIPYLATLIAKPCRGELRYRLNRISNVCDAASTSFTQRLIAKSAYIPLERIRELLKGNNSLWKVEEFITDLMKDCQFSDPFYKLMYFQFRASLPDQMLTKVDRMSMAHSLEVRTPFLDHRLVEFMAGVHKNIKMPGLIRKQILRKTVAHSLPESLLKAPKKGFTIPLREWFKDASFLTQVEQLPFKKIGLDEKTIQKIVKSNAQSAEDNGNFIWMLILLGHWYNKGA